MSDEPGYISDKKLDLVDDLLCERIDDVVTGCKQSGTGQAVPD